MLALFAICLAPPLWGGSPKGADTKPAEKKAGGKTYQVPYRLTDTQHIMVRVKINGKGPYNFIVDTGAPMLYVAVPVAKKVGLPVPKKKEKGDEKEKGGEPVILDRFEIEGGVTQDKVKCIVETPYQLKGMNAMFMPGEELHGILGYTVLAHFKMEIDLTRDKMTWTRLDFDPPPPVPLKLKGKDEAIKQLEQFGELMKGFAWVLGRKPPPPPQPRGFLGVELTDKDGAVLVRAVLPKTPAAASGLRKGDRIREVDGKEVGSSAEVLRAVARVTAGQEVRLTIGRGTENREISVTAGEGL
jgi:hypothetical protein